MSTPTAPIALWRIAERFLGLIAELCGAPEELAAALMMKRREHKILCAWLRTAENMLRRLIFIEAQAIPKPNTPPPAPRPPAPRAAPIAPAPRAFELNTTFRVIVPPPQKRTRAKRRAPRDTLRRDYVSVGGVAGRFEALTRAFNDPARYAQRLARRLYADHTQVFVFLRWLRPIGHAREDDWEAAEAGAQSRAVAHFLNSS
ncbi:MAG: hypothetical protein ABUL42_04340 [Terricaulis silvestris]